MMLNKKAGTVFCKRFSLKIKNKSSFKGKKYCKFTRKRNKAKNATLIHRIMLIYILQFQNKPKFKSHNAHKNQRYWIQTQKYRKVVVNTFPDLDYIVFIYPQNIWKNIIKTFVGTFSWNVKLIFQVSMFELRTFLPASF